LARLDALFPPGDEVTIQMLNAQLSSVTRLGTGMYGTVYGATLAGLPDAHIAIKCVPTKDMCTGKAAPNAVVFTLSEAVVLCLLHSLVTSHVCPFFPLVFRAYFGPRTPDDDPHTPNDNTKYRGSFTLVEECAVDLVVTSSNSVSVAFQALVAHLAMLKLGIVHRDLRLENVLAHKVAADTVIDIAVAGKRYCVKTHGVVLRVADPGLAYWAVGSIGEAIARESPVSGAASVTPSNPLAVVRQYTEMGTIELPLKELWTHHGSSDVHAATVANFSSFACDIIGFFGSVYVNCGTTAWLQAAQLLAQRGCIVGNHGFRTISHVEEYIHCIFGADFLTANGETYNDTFREVDEAVPAQYTVPVDDIDPRAQLLQSGQLPSLTRILTRVTTTMGIFHETCPPPPKRAKG
jgi:hypothetical protein